MVRRKDVGHVLNQPRLMEEMVVPEEGRKFPVVILARVSISKNPNMISSDTSDLILTLIKTIY